MRKLLLMAALPAAWLFPTKSMANRYTLTDSSKIAHVLDGNISEWNIAKFETDPDTKSQYAVDNDGENLYVAIKITNQRTQLSIMTQGMTMCIDKKGKKREGTNIQFPLKQSVPGFSGRGGGGGSRPESGTPGGPPDPKVMRENLAPRLLFLKPFGMENLEDDKVIVITQPGMVNIAFDWDEENNMYIEYKVPFIFIAETASLKDKPVSIGWKLPGGEMTSGSNVPIGLVTRPVGGGGGGRGGGGNGRNGVVDPTNSSMPEVREKSFWTKYVVTF